MSILVNSASRILVQGITGKEGSFHTTQMVEYGTPVVGGVTPGGAGKSVAGAPVFDTVADAVAAVKNHRFFCNDCAVLRRDHLEQRQQHIGLATQVLDDELALNLDGGPSPGVFVRGAREERAPLYEHAPIGPTPWLLVARERR